MRISDWSSDVCSSDLQRGARVYIASRRRSMIGESARQMAEATGAEVTGLVVDVRHPDQVEALIEMIWDDGGPLTGLVNSAAGNFIARTEAVSVNGFTALTAIQFRSEQRRVGQECVSKCRSRS